MNTTQLEHMGFAVAIMVVVWIVSALCGVTFGHWLGAAAGIAFFAGREYTQGQRVIAKAKGVILSELKWWEGLQVWKWGTDGILDLVAPTALCLLISIIA